MFIKTKNNKNNSNKHNIFYNYAITNVVAPNYVRESRVLRYKHAKRCILFGISKTTAFVVGTRST